MLQCAYFLTNRPLFDDALKKIRQLKYGVQSNKALSPLYSWEEIQGLQFFRQGRYSQSLKTLKKVNTTRFNTREATYLLYEQAQALHASNNLPEAHRLLKDVSKQGNQLHIVTLAKNKEWMTFEKHE